MTSCKTTFNPIDEQFIDSELKQILYSRAEKRQQTDKKRGSTYSRRMYHWRKRFNTGKLATGKKIEILLTYGGFELTKKKN